MAHLLRIQRIGGMEMELIFDRVTKQYKEKIAVDRVSLSLTQGVYGLLGANGAGKTTLMRLMWRKKLTGTSSVTCRSSLDIIRIFPPWIS